MPITATGTPINRSNTQLPNEVSAEILQKTQEASIIMQLARQIPLPGNGVQIPVIASDPTAEWVTETGTKPVSTPTLDKKIMHAPWSAWRSSQFPRRIQLRSQREQRTCSAGTG